MNCRDLIGYYNELIEEVKSITPDDINLNIFMWMPRYFYADKNMVQRNITRRMKAKIEIIKTLNTIIESISYSNTIDSEIEVNQDYFYKWQCKIDEIKGKR